MFKGLIRFACMLVCIWGCTALIASCASVARESPQDSFATVTSTYHGRIEGDSGLRLVATSARLARNSWVPTPEPAPPDPHWSELLSPLREFTDDDWQRIRKVQRHVRQAARKEGISPSLINGVIWVESKFFPKVRGSRGPRGLMQLMPVTARTLAKRLERPYRPHSPSFNIHVGVHYLARLLERFDGDMHLALAAYNQGPGPIMTWQEEGAQSPKPRMPYVSRVFRAAHAFCERLADSREEPRSGAYVCPQYLQEALAEDSVQLTAEQQVLKARTALAKQL